MMLVNLFYTVVDMVTGSTNTVLAYIKHISFNEAKFGEASAMAWIYFFEIALLLSVAALVLIIFKKRSEHNGSVR